MGIAEMKRLAITTAGLYSLSVGKIRGIAIPVPDEASREGTLAKVEQLMKLCDDLEARLQRTETTASKLVEAVVREMIS
jgi:type I restriction enzyme S subunit